MRNDIIQASVWFVTILFSMFIFTRVLNHKTTGIFVCIRAIAFSSVLVCFIYLLRDIIPFSRFVFMILFLTVFLGITTKNKATQALTGTLISIGISYGIYFVTAFIATAMVFFTLGEQRFILTTVISIILHPIIIICFFRIKRFSRGIPFLQKKAASIIGCSLSAVIFIVFLIVNRGISEENGGWIIAGTALCVMGLIYWWRRGLTKQYRERVVERNIKELELIINEKDIQIIKLQEDNEMMARIIHRDNKILPSLIENVLLYMRSDRNKTLNANQILEQVEQLLKERTNILNRELYESTVIKKQINPIIDGIIKHMMKRASAQGVQFEISQMSDFTALMESDIKPIKLQTLLADLIENAIHATEDSNTKHVLISLSSDNGVLELCVFDSGVCFDADTLFSLGKKKTTTRTGEGGRGIGYMEIFKIINESNASLTISEFEPARSHFTKSISIRFDDKKEHTLQTYRAKKIMSSCTGDASTPLLSIKTIQ